MKLKIYILLLAAILSGCASGKPTPPPMKVISGKNVEMSVSQDSTAIQEHGKIRVILEPINTSLTPCYLQTIQSAVTLVEINGKSSYKVTKTPMFCQKSKNSSMRLKLTNLSERVLRGRGSVFTFELDGQGISMPEKAYVELSNLMLVPKQTKEIVVSGPALKLFQNVDGLLRVGIYDLSVDGKYNNFEWYISYKGAPITKELPIITNYKYLSGREIRAMHNKFLKADVVM